MNAVVTKEMQGRLKHLGLKGVTQVAWHCTQHIPYCGVVDSQTLNTLQCIII